MEYRNLGRTGVKVSPLCLGSMNFGGRTDEADSIAIIAHAIDAGINFVDTANVYGYDSTNYPAREGKSEEIVGKALKQNSLPTTCSTGASSESWSRWPKPTGLP